VRLRRRGAPPIQPPATLPAPRAAPPPEGAPGGGLRPITHAEHVMGTVVSFAVLPAVPSPREPAGAASGWKPAGPDPAAAIRAACARLHEADAVFSTWDPRSPLSRLRGGSIPEADGPPSLAEVRAVCETARDASAGWFDPWAMPGGYDPTGLVKGWAVDRALDALHQAGLPAALVNGGGDLAAFGGPAPGEPWRAGIRHPWRPAALAAVLEVRGAVATSGTYERGAHLVDPHTGRPACRAASATVTGPSLAMADALATALAVGGDTALRAIGELAGYAGYLIRPDGTETWTSGMPFARP
jgi:thiamine biosynthesis lipoprotein